MYKFMKRFFAPFAVSLCVAVVCFGQPSEIVPKPESLQMKDGSFVLSRNTRIGWSDEDSRTVASAFNEIIYKNYGFRLESTQKKQRNAIIFATAPSVGGRARKGEWYSINIDPNEIRISGEVNGLFYALQTLLQLLPVGKENEVRIPSLEIRDTPRFQYRGMHLDVSRHFQPVEFVKKYIDLMAQFKFNTFHWHLTDDQGWRIEIKKYPKLTTLGQYRNESHEGTYSTTFKGDGRPVEGFYTQEQIKDVVAYAKARYINVIPEIELPGHASAALAAYPELGKGCAAPDYKFEVKKTWGIFKEVFCPTEETFKFLEDVLDETIKLFPDSPYVHIGGDEVLKDFWKESAFVQELKKRENLKDEHEVQSYFVRRMEKFVNSKGKKIIGWDEILEGGIAPNATIMSWRGMKGGIEAAKAKHDVIMTPTDFVYFDYGQGDPAYEPLNIGGYVPLEKVYSFEPVPPELTAEEAKYILGGQANIWSEYLETPAAIEYMAYPRMLALSEVLWSRKEDRNFADFKQRMNAVLPRLDKRNVNYRIPEPMPTGAFLVPEDGTYTVDIKPPFPEAKVRFTTDGRNPTETSPEAPAKFVANPKGDEVLQLKTIVVLPGGRKSSTYAAVFLRRKMREPDVTSSSKQGVTYRLTSPSSEFAQDPPATTGETKSIMLTQFEKQIDLKKSFTVSFDGYLKIPVDGVYEFQLDSTWDAALLIGGSQTVIDEAGTKDRSVKAVILPLKAGLHRLTLRYNHRGEVVPHFRLRYGLKGQGLRQAYGGEFVN